MVLLRETTVTTVINIRRSSSSKIIPPRRRTLVLRPFTTAIRSSRYEEAIWALNSLQSNANVLERARRNPLETSVSSLPLTVKYLARIGLSVNDLDRLNVVHVSGTKGKGSTCAFCESILRRHDYKTGFYSSPHVIAVRERIRINGKPLSEETFATYFWEVYDQLSKKKQDDWDMPPYFKFLTIMAFHVFLKEKVDVAVIEVGIGGQYDCTNVIRKPVVCGVSSLGLDHTHILGISLAEIAWQKGGIFKPNVTAFTSPQNDEAIRVLRDRAKTTGCPLLMSQSVETHDWKGRNLELGLAGKVQLMNAGLAIQLANCWLHFRKSSSVIVRRTDLIAPRLEITDKLALGLRNCHWPGRHQVFRSTHTNVTYFLDGAHTPESTQTCVEWFCEASVDETFNLRSDCVKRILLFNSTGVRSSESLLSPLVSAHFDHALFCPNTISATAGWPSDQINVAVTKDESLNHCECNRASWLKLQKNYTGSDRIESNLVFPGISDALAWISTKYADEETIRCHVLVTGSLHLVGGVLSILDPGLVESLKTTTTTGSKSGGKDQGHSNGRRRASQLQTV